MSLSVYSDRVPAQHMFNVKLIYSTENRTRVKEAMPAYLKSCKSSPHGHNTPELIEPSTCQLNIAPRNCEPSEAFNITQVVHHMYRRLHIGHMLCSS